MFVCDDGAQAVSARSIVSGQLGMRGKSVARSTKSLAHFFRHFRGNGNDANGQNRLFLTILRIQRLILLSTVAIVR